MSQLNEHISQLREDFMKGKLSENDISSYPHIVFEQWMQEAINAKVNEVQAFHLSTVSKEGKPSGRILYLREFFNDDYYFYTNYKSRKSLDISNNNFGSFTFFWPELERQIRMEGTIELAGKEKSDAYFNVRPRESKIGAWSSPQSKVIDNREALDDFVKNNTDKFENQEIPRPDHWGGYVFTANYYEFWQGRKSRLHDRISFTKNSNAWNIARLAP